MPPKTGQANVGWRRRAQQRQEARGQLSAPVYSGNTDLKRFHFSTVFVAVLWGAGLPESEASFPRPHRVQPRTGLRQETSCFQFTGPCQALQAGPRSTNQLYGESDCSPAAAGSPQPVSGAPGPQRDLAGSLRGLTSRQIWLQVPGSFYGFSSRCTQ